MSNRTSCYSSFCASLLLRMGFIVRQCWFVGISTSLFYTVYNATYSPRDSSILGSTDWLPLNWTDTKLTLVQWWCNKKRLRVRWMVATRKTAWNTPESSSSFSFSSSSTIQFQLLPGWCGMDCGVSLWKTHLVPCVKEWNSWLRRRSKSTKPPPATREGTHTERKGER